MIKGEKVRFDIYNILFSIYKFNLTLNSASIQKIIDKQKRKDVALLHNVTLNSMRYHLHCIKIINKFINKKIKIKEKILLISAITQIVFLDFKDYAVINCSVEISKKLKLYPGLINASLKKISMNKEDLKKISINFNDFPTWFQKKTYYLSSDEKKRIIKYYYREPNIHLVFKDENKLKKFEEKLIRTSEISGFLLNKRDIITKKSFIRGDWWIQDFSSFFPLYNLKLKNKNTIFLDACAAPGGKSFQLLSKNHRVVLNDKNKLRIETLKSNLTRLNFKAQILNKDFTKFSEKIKYDYVIVDAPCSAVGTIRKNPEIFFKNQEPNFKKLNFLQEKMLEKAANLVNKDGCIIYMTCSFLKNETVDQINHFLKKNSNFVISNFKLIKENINYSKFINENFMITIPDKIFNNSIDGYFAAYLKKKHDINI